MRVSREQAEKNRITVLKSASRLFRDRGFDGVGIADIMRAAGLTHGGFYGQFGSKEHLAIEASARIFGATCKKWEKITSEAEADAVDALADFYLSAEHRNARADGCPIAALATDAARSGPELQAAFHDGITGHLEILTRACAERGDAEPREAALATLASLVGAVILSRAVGDAPLGTEILDTVRAHQKHPPDG